MASNIVDGVDAEKDLVGTAYILPSFSTARIVEVDSVKLDCESNPSVSGFLRTDATLEFSVAAVCIRPGDLCTDT
jgi:hypothetical protein